MKAKFLNRAVEQYNSLAIEQHSGSYFKKLWHYHPEMELMLIEEGTGSLFVGDSVEKFEPGSIVLIGKNLPHLWQNDKIYFEKNSSLTVQAQTVHFNDDFAERLLAIPEMAGLYQLLQRAGRGIKFSGKANQTIIPKIKKLATLSGYPQIIAFLDILQALATHRQCKLLSSLGYLNSFKEIRDTKVLSVYEYIMNNFKEKVNLSKAAGIANMNASAFSRYFASIQKKPFTQFINEVRIGYACKLLIDGTHNITGACFESGFNNLSNFNRQFLRIKNMSPSAFIRQHASNQ